MGQRAPLVGLGHEHVQAIPVKQLFTFFQSLPTPDLQQITRTVEGRWQTSTPTTGSLILASFAVPAQTVFIITDVLYYALCPSALYEGPLVALEEHQLAGLVRFDLSFNQTSPMETQATTASPYAAASTAASERSGWPMLNVPFGARRSSGFALFARSQQVVNVTAYIDVSPRFAISKLGAHLHGFSAPESRFEEAFRKPTQITLPKFDNGEEG